MTQQRCHFGPEQKVAPLRLHLVDKVSVFDVCEKHDIPVSLFYSWQKVFFENSHVAFTHGDKRRQTDATIKDRKICRPRSPPPTQARGPLRTHGGAHIQLKKALGEL